MLSTGSLNGAGVLQYTTNGDGNEIGIYIRKDPDLSVIGQYAFVYMEDKDGNSLGDPKEIGVGLAQYYEIFTFPNLRPDILNIYIIPFHPLDYTGISIVVIPSVPPTKNAGGKLILSERLGFETQFDFMKFFAQAFGLTFVVDEKTKHIHAFTFHLLYDNIKSGNVKDWSKKLDVKKQLFDFTLDKYAQENIIPFEKNEQDEIVDSGKFYLDYETLQNSKELFKLNIGAGIDVVIDPITGSGFKTSAAIPLVELKRPDDIPEESDWMTINLLSLRDASFPTIKPHLVELLEETVSAPAGLLQSNLYDYQTSRHIPAQELVDIGYSILSEKMLKNARKVEANFYLTPEDIEQFDPSIPVWIENYGTYFYLSKIKNFELGKLTACELVRL